jgi:HD superfamily phosphodiesterase
MLKIKKTYGQWEKILTRELLQLWANSKQFLLCHGPEHHIRVWKNAERFGLKKGADMEILLACSLLHDVSSFNQSSPKNHEVISARIADKVLRKVNFPINKISAVTEAIAGHRSTKTTTSIEGKIFKSFDKIDAFGPIGVYRILLPLSIRRYTLAEIVSWALKDQHLAKKWASIAFPELRKQYRADYEFTRRYFEALRSRLKLTSLKSNYSEQHVFAR